MCGQRDPQLTPQGSQPVHEWAWSLGPPSPLEAMGAG